MSAITTSDRRKADALWLALGGEIVKVRRTGEVRYRHPAFARPITSSAPGRRKDTPAILLTRLNQLLHAGGA